MIDDRYSRQERPRSAALHREPGSPFAFGLLLLIASMFTLAPHSARAASRFNVDNTDACTLASAAVIRPVLTTRPLDIKSEPAKAKDGGSACDWEAYDKGLASTARPEFTLTVVTYRLKDPAETAKLFAESWPDGLVPADVRTADASDQVARPDRDMVAVRHGGNVVVLSAQDQEESIKHSAGRIYQLEALAFRMAGATVLGPTDPRVTETACAPIPPQHALSVLTLEPSSLNVDGDGYRCTMEVKDGSLDETHSIENRGEAQIESEDLGTRAAALAYQKYQTPFLLASTLVHTADPGDRLLTNTSQPEQVTVVHGSHYVELNVTNVTSDAKASPGWLYREQRLALEAAGATIVPTAGMPPDPVVPGPQRKKHAPDEQWTPSAYHPPVASALLAPLILVMDLLARHRFFVLAVMIVLPSVGGGILGARAKEGRRSAKRHILLILAFVAFAIFNMVAGEMVANTLIYHFGAAGSATITASEMTDVQYNNHDVSRHDVLLRTADGKIVETSFEDDDFNVYPFHNEVSYPGKGDRFSVRYLPAAPSHFVIVANDNSPWATGLRCNGLTDDIYTASEKMRFAPGNKAYQTAYHDAISTALNAGCDASQ